MRRAARRPRWAAPRTRVAREAGTSAASGIVAAASLQAGNGAEAKRLLALLKGDRLEAIYRLMLGLGLRRGEVCGLLKTDLDLERAELTISGSLQRYDNALRRDEPKTAKSRATLPLSPSLVSLLRELLDRQEEERKQAGDDWQETGYLFTTHIGTPFDPQNINRHLRGLLEQANIKDITPHSFRHSCATFLLASGENPRIVSEILRHADPSLTMRVCARLYYHSGRENLTTGG